MTLSSLVVFALTLLITAGPPGPSVAALLARVLTHGFRDVLPFLIAMWFGEAFWLTCAVTGLAVLAHQFALAFLTLKFASVAYLLFLAARMWFTLEGMQRFFDRQGAVHARVSVDFAREFACLLEAPIVDAG